jgi:HSP20 family molecular chaperone IbpA
MTNLARFHAANLPELVERINRNSIGLDDYLNRFWNESIPQNYPPYNLVNVSNVESRLEVALAGFKKDEIKVYTEYGKLIVEAQIDEKEDKDNEFFHRGLARRSFTRSWAMSDDTEVRSANFEDGLLIVSVGKIVPEHHARKDWL